MDKPHRIFEAAVVGVSAGGTQALPDLISPLPPELPLSIIIVQHIAPTPDNSYFISYLNNNCDLTVKEAEEKELIETATVYLAPPDYHLLIERDHTFSLSVDDRVNYSRPSIDVLFECAADVFNSGLIGIVLTGSNSDGSRGLRKIKDHGGLTIVQDPLTAEYDAMPASAIDICKPDYILKLNEIGELLAGLCQDCRA